MQLDKNAFSLAAACVMGVVYIVCAAFVMLFPELSLQLFGWMVHLVNVDKFAGDVAITLGGFIIGFLQVVVYTFIGAYLFVWLHNRFLKNSAV